MKNEKKYFMFDFETGGFSETEESPLSVYGIILNSNLEKLDEIDLKIMPDDGRYHVHIDALKVNKIDLLKHAEVAISATDAGVKLRDFLFKHGTTGRLIPSGHNIDLDVRFAKSLVPDWRSLCEHRWLDTSTIAQFLQLLGKIPMNNNGSLAQLSKHFGIDTTNHHDAKVDVGMCHSVLTAMVNLLGGIPNPA